MRTWDENKTAINQLWPMAQFTDEERRLWHDDLGGLDQAVLYDAIRNVKRTHDSLYPQIKWILDEVRGLSRLKKVAEQKAKTSTQEKREVVVIDAATDKRMKAELTSVVEMATQANYRETVDLIASKAAALQIEMATACSLVLYLLARLGLKRGNVLGDAT